MQNPEKLHEKQTDKKKKTQTNKKQSPAHDFDKAWRK